MHNSQGSSKDIFSRPNSQVDAFGLSLSQDWTTGFSQDSRSLPVPCTPSNTFGFQGSSESFSQNNIPGFKWNHRNTGTPAYQDKDHDSQISRKIMFGLTAVFKIVSELPEKLKANHGEGLQCTKTFIAKADEFQSLFSKFKDLKQHEFENGEELMKIYALLDVLNSKIRETQELFDGFQKSFQQDISKKNGILLKKLSMKINAIQTWITDFQKLQNHSMSLKYEEILNSQREMLTAFDKKWETKFDNLTSQLIEMKTVVEKIWDLNNKPMIKTGEMLSSNVRSGSQNQYFLQDSNNPFAKKILKPSPVARIQPMHNKIEVGNIVKKLRNVSPAKCSLDISFPRTKEVQPQTVKDRWCELTPEWSYINNGSNSTKKRKLIQNETKVIVQTPSKIYQNMEYSTDTSFEENYLPKNISSSHELCMGDKVFPFSRPMSRLNFQSRFLGKR